MAIKTVTMLSKLSEFLFLTFERALSDFFISYIIWAYRRRALYVNKWAKIFLNLLHIQELSFLKLLLFLLRVNVFAHTSNSVPLSTWVTRHFIKWLHCCLRDFFRAAVTLKMWLCICRQWQMHPHYLADSECIAMSVMPRYG